MKSLRLGAAFKKDLKRVVRRGYNRSLLEDVVTQLRKGLLLEGAHRDHPLRGDWHGFRECHIKPDWLLIYGSTDSEVLLARTGTHADLFGE